MARSKPCRMSGAAPGRTSGAQTTHAPKPFFRVCPSSSGHFLLRLLECCPLLLFTLINEAMDEPRAGMSYRTVKVAMLLALVRRVGISWQQRLGPQKRQPGTANQFSRPQGLGRRPVHERGMRRNNSPAVAEMALGFRRLRLSNRDLFVNTSSALPVEHTPWVGQAGRERRAPVSRFCQGGRGTGVRASYAPRRNRGSIAVEDQHSCIGRGTTRRGI
jgi:hypothetical protein